MDWLSRLPVGSSASTQRRRGDQGPGHRDPLLLAAGELVRLVVAAIGQADEVERGPGPAAPFGGSHPRVRQRQLDIGQRGRARDQVERLEHEADPAVAHQRELPVVEAGLTSTPSSRYWPPVGMSRQPRMFISVDLPEPDEPMIAT